MSKCWNTTIPGPPSPWDPVPQPVEGVRTRLRRLSDGAVLWDFDDAIGQSDSDGKIAITSDDNPFCFTGPDPGPTETFEIDVEHYSTRVDVLKATVRLKPLLGPIVRHATYTTIPLGPWPHYFFRFSLNPGPICEIVLHSRKPATVGIVNEPCDQNYENTPCCFCAETDPYYLGKPLHGYVPTRRGPILLTCGPLTCTLTPRSASEYPPDITNATPCVEWWGGGLITMSSADPVTDWRGFKVCPDPLHVADLASRPIPVIAKLTCATLTLYYALCRLTCRYPPEYAFDCYEPSIPPAEPPWVAASFDDVSIDPIAIGHATPTYSGPVVSISCDRDGPIAIGGTIVRVNASYPALELPLVNATYSPFGATTAWTASEVLP